MPWPAPGAPWQGGGTSPPRAAPGTAMARHHREHSVKMHDGEADIDAGLVRRLLAAQFPDLACLPVSEVRSVGTVNAIYRVGGALCARLPRLARWAGDLEAELRWLPELAPHLPLRVPEPVAAGRAGQGYPFRWALIRWISGRPYADGLIDDETAAARELAGFVTRLRGMPRRPGRRPPGASPWPAWMRAPGRRSRRPGESSTPPRRPPPGIARCWRLPGTAARRCRSTPTCCGPTCWQTAAGCTR